MYQPGRGTAALCVLFLHWFDGVGYPWFRNAGLAVDFFFLLSGFVIAYSYEDKLRTTLSAQRFLWLRFVRLYPMILAAVVLGMLRHVLHNALLPSAASWPDYLEAGIAGLLMLPILHITPLTPHPLVAGSAFPLDMVLWSLFYEAVANIAYALFIKKIKAALSAVIIAGWLGLVVTHLPALNATRLLTIFSAASFRVVFSFFLGVALFRLKNAWPKISAGPVALSAVLMTIAAMPVQSAVFDLFIITTVLPLLRYSALTITSLPTSTKPAASLETCPIPSMSSKSHSCGPSREP